MNTEFNTAGEILAYLTDKTIENQAQIQKRKRHSKSEVRRHESITAVGLRGLEIFKAVEDAKAYPRVYEPLKAREGQTPPNEVKTFYTLEETIAYVLECTLATLGHNEFLSRATVSEGLRLKTTIDAALAGVRKFGLEEGAKRARCGRVLDRLGIERE